jgi:NADH-quinone oxidoreductase subunit D
MFEADRSAFPEIKDGVAQFDLLSGKYVKIWQGPQHPGITGNMSLELVVSGDEVFECKTHVGYLHRGFEKLMERRLYIQSFPLACRICVPEPDFNEYLFARAVEDLAGIEIPPRAEWLRILTLEMARLTSFLMWIGGQANAFGFAAVGQWSLVHRDYMLDLFEELSGMRIYHLYIIPGGVRNEIPGGFCDRLEATLCTVESLLRDIEIVLLHNAVFKARAIGLGYIDPSWIDTHGITGPNMRAAGVARDLRKDVPNPVYRELDFSPITMTGSDAYDRTVVRFREMEQSISLIRQILRKMPEGPIHSKLPNVFTWKIPAGQTYVKAECTRGEYGYFMVSDGSAFPRRVCVRGPSYTHAIAVMEKLAVGVNLADIAGLMVSLHTYPPEIER